MRLDDRLFLALAFLLPLLGGTLGAALVFWLLS